MNEPRAPSEPPFLDRLAAGGATQSLAFVWGFAEATVFFLVPDVLLTLIACRSLSRALKGALWSLAGAMAGGIVMYLTGRASPGAARALLVSIPGIDDSLVASVSRQLEEQGLIALLLGPLQGIPYKIYAVAAGAGGTGLPGFLLVSIPARLLRFAATAACASLIVRMLAPLTHRRADVEMALHALFWILFYLLYFGRLG